MPALIISRLGKRNQKATRLWIEESINKSRLEANGFPPSSPLNVSKRQGPGLIIRRTTGTAKHHISKRGCKSLLSLEGFWLQNQFPWQEAKIRVHYNTIVVVPSLQCWQIGKLAAHEARLTGKQIHFHGQTYTYGHPPFRSRPEVFSGEVTASNLLLASQFIRTHLPRILRIQGDESLLVPFFQFCRSLNYLPETQEYVISI